MPVWAGPVHFSSPAKTRIRSNSLPVFQKTRRFGPRSREANEKVALM